MHGVLVVPQLHRVFATATGSNPLVALDEATGRELWRAPTGDYPDGIAYVPSTGQVWVSNETGGTETAVDATNGHVAGTVELGGEAGNVAFDDGAAKASATVLVDVQSSNELVAIDPVTRAIRHRTRLGGCDHDHGLVELAPRRLAFIACDGNNKLLVLNLASGRITERFSLGRDPDILSLDPANATLLVAAESGTATVFRLDPSGLKLRGRALLADGVHVVAVHLTAALADWPLADAHHHPQLLITRTRP